MTSQMTPPLKVSGDCVTSCQISVSLSFHVANAVFRLLITQLSDMLIHLAFQERWESASGHAAQISAARLCSCSCGDERKDFLGEENDNAAEEGQEAVGPLAGVMAFKGQAHLNDAETQKDNADGLDGSKDEVAELVDGLDGVGDFTRHSRGHGHDKSRDDEHSGKVADVCDVERTAGHARLILFQMMPP